MATQGPNSPSTTVDDATVKKCYNKHMKQCLTCKNKFIQKSNTRGLFCSRKCAGSFNAPIHKGKHYSTSTEFKKGHKKIGGVDFVKGVPSFKRGIPQYATRGDKNPNWRGGTSSEQDKLRHNIEMNLWRKSCMERDNFTDAKTGIRGGDLVVHHINNFLSFPELRTSLENGITLSKESHKLFHKIYGIRNNTREQLTEFLTNKII